MRAGGGDNSMMGTLVVRAGGQRAPFVLLPRLFCVGVVSGAGVPLLAFRDAVVVVWHWQWVGNLQKKGPSEYEVL